MSATVVLDTVGRLMADPTVALRGIDDGTAGEEAAEDLIDLVIEVVEGMGHAARRRDDAVRGAVERALRREIRQTYGKRPVTDIHLIRI